MLRNLPGTRCGTIIAVAVASMHGPVWGGDACGEPKTGSCCTPSPFAFCEDASCCVAVCDADPFCCQIEWDVTCAGIALGICESCTTLQCGDPAAGNCCATNGSPGCSEVWCCEAVCAEDGFCCDVTWDAKCAARAAAVCNGCEGAVCRSDLNFDGEVDGADLVKVLAAWGPCAPSDPCLADLNADGAVDGPDLAEMLSSWGPCD
jgi:hypothetical protein